MEEYRDTRIVEDGEVLTVDDPDQSRLQETQGDVGKAVAAAIRERSTASAAPPTPSRAATPARETSAKEENDHSQGYSPTTAAGKRFRKKHPKTPQPPPQQQKDPLQVMVEAATKNVLTKGIL